MQKQLIQLLSVCVLLVMLATNTVAEKVLATEQGSAIFDFKSGSYAAVEIKGNSEFQESTLYVCAGGQPGESFQYEIYINGAMFSELTLNEANRFTWKKKMKYHQDISLTISCEEASMHTLAIKLVPEETIKDKGSYVHFPILISSNDYVMSSAFVNSYVDKESPNYIVCEDWNSAAKKYFKGLFLEPVMINNNDFDGQAYVQKIQKKESLAHNQSIIIFARRERQGSELKHKKESYRASYFIDMDHYESEFFQRYGSKMRRQIFAVQPSMLKEVKVENTLSSIGVLRENMQHFMISKKAQEQLGMHTILTEGGQTIVSLDEKVINSAATFSDLLRRVRLKSNDAIEELFYIQAKMQGLRLYKMQEYRNPLGEKVLQEEFGAAGPICKYFMAKDDYLFPVAISNCITKTEYKWVMEYQKDEKYYYHFDEAPVLVRYDQENKQFHLSTADELK